ncbi:hypothetical protein MHU86_23378 [Fragilaria crotonensis]|nr:hypothetical protein MHU86_23378 [Fragilaria crotonensis]
MHTPRASKIRKILRKIQQGESHQVLLRNPEYLFPEDSLRFLGPNKGPGYILDVLSQNAKEHIHWRTNPDDVETVVEHLRAAEVEHALVANHLNKILFQSALSGPGKGQDVSLPSECQERKKP